MPFSPENSSPLGIPSRFVRESISCSLSLSLSHLASYRRRDSTWESEEEEETNLEFGAAHVSAAAKKRGAIVFGDY